MPSPEKTGNMRKSNIIRGILLRLANICGGTDALANIGALRQHTPRFIRRRRRFGGAATRPLDVPPWGLPEAQTAGILAA